MIVKLLTEHYLEFLSLKRVCAGSSESTLVKMPHCWKSHVTAHLFFVYYILMGLSICFDKGTLGARTEGSLKSRCYRRFNTVDSSICCLAEVDIEVTFDEYF